MFRGIPVWRFLQGIPVQIEDFDQSEVRHERVAKAVFQFRDAVPAFADELDVGEQQVRSTLRLKSVSLVTPQCNTGRGCG